MAAKKKAKKTKRKKRVRRTKTPAAAPLDPLDLDDDDDPIDLDFENALFEASDLDPELGFGIDDLDDEDPVSLPDLGALPGFGSAVDLNTRLGQTFVALGGFLTQAGLLLQLPPGGGSAVDQARSKEKTEIDRVAGTRKDEIDGANLKATEKRKRKSAVDKLAKDAKKLLDNKKVTLSPSHAVIVREVFKARAQAAANPCPFKDSFKVKGKKVNVFLPVGRKKKVTLVARMVCKGRDTPNFATLTIRSSANPAQARWSGSWKVSGDKAVSSIDTSGCAKGTLLLLAVPKACGKKPRCTATVLVQVK